MTKKQNDHGGGLDSAAAKYGGTRDQWIDLSTGINPLPYEPDFRRLSKDAWTALPDQGAQDALSQAARDFWQVPEGAAILAAPGASALIANMPRLQPKATVSIEGPTYNEHASAFDQSGWSVIDTDQPSTAQVVVHPNNPDGRLWKTAQLRADFRIIDESFCDVMPESSLIRQAGNPGTIILKSFGKFWGLAGLRLGFAIGDPNLIAALKNMLGPWPVSGPALEIGRSALLDVQWAQSTRERLKRDAQKLDQLMIAKGANLVGGTTLFRLYDVEDAQLWQDRLAQQKIWSRVFPYEKRWLRLGLPHPLDWNRIQDAL